MPPEDDWYRPLVPVLADLLGACGEYGARVVVIGGVAASSLGEPRFTEDIDATCDADPDHVEQFFPILERYGLVPRRPDYLELAQKGRILTLHHIPTATPVDVSLALLPFEHEVLARAQKVQLGSLEVPIATAEDICIMKVVAATDRIRPKYDERDVRQILASHPDLDLRRIRSYLPQFAAALERPEIVELFERLWKETRTNRRRGSGPDSDANRGTA